MVIVLVGLKGIENVDAIATVDGVDVVWLDHYDLTNFMGIWASSTRNSIRLSIVWSKPAGSMGRRQASSQATRSGRVISVPRVFASLPTASIRC